MGKFAAVLILIASWSMAGVAHAQPYTEPTPEQVAEANRVNNDIAANFSGSVSRPARPLLKCLKSTWFAERIEGEGVFMVTFGNDCSFAIRIKAQAGLKESSPATAPCEPGEMIDEVILPGGAARWETFSGTENSVRFAIKKTCFPAITSLSVAPTPPPPPDLPARPPPPPPPTPPKAEWWMIGTQTAPGGVREIAFVNLASAKREGNQISWHLNTYYERPNPEGWTWALLSIKSDCAARTSTLGPYSVLAASGQLERGTVPADRATHAIKVNSPSGKVFRRLCLGEQSLAAALPDGKEPAGYAQDWFKGNPE